MNITIQEQPSSTWSLTKGQDSFECNHDTYHSEEAEHPSFNPEGPAAVSTVHVCDDCDEIIDTGL